MGKHQPFRTSLWERVKSSRVVAATAVGAVLIAGGTAGAAVVGDTGTTDNTGAPPANTAEPHEPTPQSADEQRQATQQRDEATSSAHQSFTSSLTPEEQHDEGQDSPASGSADNDTAEHSPTGQGGSCEASNYSEPQPTANGETFDPSAMTAAHKELPFDTMVEVTNPANGSSVTVRINDRGPFIEGRCLDLSTASFEQIASPNQGVVDVEWQVVE
ncbi:septal ring lytic transglycosylase RlpA family protein [Halostreptopolyspora alba]|uniref:septal ring lytic transglycosylase RlpA family protein n=1 Tax=Halostreptopolyspora alba TaxID=2487137 RepID=UPI0026CF9F2E